jgi:hypothetical protein
MVVTQMDIEERAVEYMTNNYPRKPRFVLLDPESYKAFNKICFAKERILDANGNIQVQPKTPYRIEKIHCTDCELRILEVDTDKEIFEVVG